MTWFALVTAWLATGPSTTVAIDASAACAPREVLQRELRRAPVRFVDEDAELTIRLDVEHAGYRLRVSDADGLVMMERELPTPSCEEAAVAAALIIDRALRDIVVRLPPPDDAGVRTRRKKVTKKPPEPPKVNEAPGAAPDAGRRDERAQATLTPPSTREPFPSTRDTPRTPSSRTNEEPRPPPARTEGTARERPPTSPRTTEKTPPPTPRTTVDAPPATTPPRSTVDAPPGTTPPRPGDAPPPTSPPRTTVDAAPPTTPPRTTLDAPPPRPEETPPIPLPARPTPRPTLDAPPPTSPPRREETPPIPPTLAPRTASGTPPRPAEPTPARTTAATPATPSENSPPSPPPITSVSAGELPRAAPRLLIAPRDVEASEEFSREPRRLHFELTAGGGLAAPTPATVSLLLALDGALRLPSVWRLGLLGAFSFGGSAPVLDEQGRTRGTLSSQTLFLLPHAMACLDTTVEVCGGVRAGARLAAGTAAGPFLFQTRTAFAPAPTAGLGARAAFAVGPVVLALDVTGLVNLTTPALGVEGLPASIQTPRLELLVHLSAGGRSR